MDIILRGKLQKREYWRNKFFVGKENFDRSEQQNRKAISKLLSIIKNNK